MSQSYEEPQASTTPPVQQIEIIQRSSRVRTAAMVGLAAGAFALAGAIYKGCGESSVKVDIDTSMEHLAASRAQPFIEYGGKTSAAAGESLHVPGWIPGIGGDEVPLTKNTSTAGVGGVAELRTDRDAFLKWENHDDGSTHVEVDASKVYIQYSMAVQFKDGKPVADSKMEPFSVTTGDGILKRGFIAEEGARRAFVYRCGKIAVNTLPAGVKLFVHDIKELVDNGQRPGGASKQPGGVTSEEIEAFKKIKVTFKQSVAGPGGRLVKKTIDPADIQLRMRDMTQTPPRIIPLTRDEISLNNLETKNDVQVVADGKCKMNQDSLKALARLTGKANPGV